MIKLSDGCCTPSNLNVVVHRLPLCHGPIANAPDRRAVAMRRGLRSMIIMKNGSVVHHNHGSNAHILHNGPLRALHRVSAHSRSSPPPSPPSAPPSVTELKLEQAAQHTTHHCCGVFTRQYLGESRKQPARPASKVCITLTQGRWRDLDVCACRAENMCIL
jgi:hypothetical protein